MIGIYLDNNATTRLDPAVGQVINDCWNRGLVNPASQHRAGQEARRQLEQDRLSILQQIGGKIDGMHPDRLLFTSGGTEANNLALFGLSRPDQQLLISAIEHPSVLAAAQHLASMNVDVRLIPVDRAGIVRLDALGDLLRQNPTGLVSVMAANNETGVIQPVEAIVKLAHQYQALVHCDAVQWVGKYPTDFQGWDVDSLSTTCHKFHGPGGIGGLCLKSGLTLRPQLFGGFQQEGLRPGTENVALAAGFSAALSRCTADKAEHMLLMRQLLESGLKEKIPQVVINGENAARMPHTSNIALLGANRQAFLLAADMQGLCLSTGSACASGSSDPSPVLVAMGCEKEVIDSSIRISLAADNTFSEIHQTIEIISRIYQSLKA